MGTHITCWRGPLSLCLAASIVIGPVGTTGAAAAGDEPGPPKLVVILMVDQMRADYVDRFHHQWKSGLKRMLTEGAWVRLAAYPYLSTVTCSGHATVATGSFPASHGVIHNTWWDRESARMIRCTETPAEPSFGDGAPAENGHNIGRLGLPTLADELRAQAGSGSRVVTLSLKARAAIMLAGRRPDTVVWLDDSGTWATSTSSASASVPFVQHFTATNPVERVAGKSWTRTLPAGDYLYTDEGIGEKPKGGWKTTFPHPLHRGVDGQSDEPEGVFYTRWSRTPYSDEYLGRMASTAVEAFNLGRGPGVDFLGVSFSALDLAGHDFGPHSHEVQDILVRLDANIGSLLADLDRLVGADDYVVALTSDHGVAPVPARSEQLGFDAGHVATRELGKTVEAALTPILGPGPHVAMVHGTGLYFRPGVYRKLETNPESMRAALDAIRAAPGVWRVFRSDELVEHPLANDPIARAARLSYYPGRSGDLIVVSKPYWLLSSNPTLTTTHGSSNHYDRRVPVIFFGRGIKQGEYLQPVTPADIAPMLAFLCGVTLAQPDGRVLTEVLEAGNQIVP